MFPVDILILVAGILLLLGIASSKLSSRAGIPVLVLFLGLGMLAGEEGIGGIVFDSYALAHAIGTLALAVILFDGGLNTPMTAFRIAWRPALALASAGVVITAAVTGAVATWLLGFSPVQGMLLGSIVGSTDAAAVFAALRSGGIRLPDRLGATLEVESGSNDPMAIFLTLGLIQVILGEMALGPDLLGLLARQALWGTIAGLAVGFAGVTLINRMRLEAEGLYPVLASTCGLLAFGIAAALGGSGFLSVYLAGIVIGNRRIVCKRGIFLFHNAGAWLAQIVMFVVLGLLSFPSRLLGVAPQGMLMAAILVFVARPLAVALTLLPFRFGWRELCFLSWGGLKGAVPITLATFPFLFGLPGAEPIFDVVFFVVLVSALVQGWTLSPLARRLGLQRPTEPAPPVALEISSLRHVEGEVVDYFVEPGSRAAGRQVRELALPQGAVIAIIARGERIVPPQGSTRLEVGDHAIVVMAPQARPLVDRVLGRETVSVALPPEVEFPLRGGARVSELEAFYGVQMDSPPEQTLDEAIRDRLGVERADPGQLVVFGPIALRVREVDRAGRVEAVGMIILPGEADEGVLPGR
ncbi:potassium/proton antiporter [Tautonia plasticadhaerens]|uniref:K(+)/H(+) antiporter NhaP n=1 Tax=Tautonia plasticadhaerens TaxID=2527974 RepID=A0A518HEP2_9BACT|nr:potassium/proton antiporter [Tautonia plasticadhaerens]QDV39329.1 K(+)/H(+) antiporter NhaP [Tautonia plasticadhaerens]